MVFTNTHLVVLGLGAIADTSLRPARLRDNVIATLETLAEREIMIALLTNRFERELYQIIDPAILSLFDYVQACDGDTPPKPDTAGLAKIIDSLSDPERRIETGNTVLIGNGREDYECAIAAGAKFIGYSPDSTQFAGLGLDPEQIVSEFGIISAIIR